MEIGTDKDNVHFLIQSVPMGSPTKIIQTLKSITAKEIFKRHPKIKLELWGENLGLKNSMLILSENMEMRARFRIM